MQGGGVILYNVQVLLVHMESHIILDLGVVLGGGGGAQQIGINFTLPWALEVSLEAQKMGINV